MDSDRQREQGMDRDRQRGHGMDRGRQRQMDTDKGKSEIYGQNLTGMGRQIEICRQKLTEMDGDRKTEGTGE